MKKRPASLKSLKNVTENAAPGGSVVEGSKPNPRARRMALGDFLAVLSLLAMVVASTVVIVAAFVGMKRNWTSTPEFVDLLKSGLASLTVPVLSTSLRLLSQRYIYARISNKGLRSRQVAHFSNWTVAEFISQIFGLRFEPLGVLLLAIWVLGVATGLTVGDTPGYDHPYQHDAPVHLPFGSLDPGQASLVASTSNTINILASLLKNQTVTSRGYVSMTKTYAGPVYYPPLDAKGIFYNSPAFFNGFQVEVSYPESIPSSASKLNCTSEYGSSTEFWLLDSTTTMLSFIHVEGSSNYTQVDSTAVLLGGVLSVFSYYDGVRGPDQYSGFFHANGTTYPLTMKDDKWAVQMMEIVCSTVVEDTVFSPSKTLLGFAIGTIQRATLSANMTKEQDFMDSTRLLLGPLNDRQLFNATLDQTIIKLENPYLQVVSDHQLLVTIAKSTKKKDENSTKEKGEDLVPPLQVEI
ncbi:hypothetical protein FRC17_005699 [Serendipita sp. 399]|nr:hypothetical protein FRC17_005699 [Serendipita sp. 399]